MLARTVSSWHIGVAAEAYTAGLFARCGFDVSVQYGANQPEYDLVIVKDDKVLKISLKGSRLPRGSRQLVGAPQATLCALLRPIQGNRPQRVSARLPRDPSRGG